MESIFDLTLEFGNLLLYFWSDNSVKISVIGKVIAWTILKPMLIKEKCNVQMCVDREHKLTVSRASVLINCETCRML